MHDCNEAEGRIVDLVFGELEAEEKLRLTAQLEVCPECLGEYRAMSDSLLLFDRAVEESTPDEGFWAEHHASLRWRLRQEAATAMPKRLPLWKRLLTARLPVPAPAAALVAVALLLSSVLALRPTNQAAPAAAPSHAAAEAGPQQLVEVPVYRERVVTRTVYVERAKGKNEESRSRSQNRKGESIAARRSESEDSLFTRANLADYQPPDEMQIRVIKRSSSDEK